MTTLAPSMRLKVKRDTFFVPEANQNGVYFRNNLHSFRMEGDMIAQWIDTLLPMFNGEHTLLELTEGLPEPHRNRVMDIAGILFENGFVKDLSQDRPHQLPEGVQKKYARQIEFLDHLGGSGAYRFQSYRETSVLAIGSGPMLLSLLSSLAESGLPKVHYLISDSSVTNKERLAKLISYARHKNDEFTANEIPHVSLDKESLGKLICDYDAVLYVSEGKTEEMRTIQQVCNQEKKLFAPAIFLQNAGFAGPIISPESEATWESAWRSVHSTVFEGGNDSVPPSQVAGALLANVLVFELLKVRAGVYEPKDKNKFYLLKPETLEGSWHHFVTHPLMDGHAEAVLIEVPEKLIGQSPKERQQEKCFLFFNQLSSGHSGIFHKWEEGEVSQLPLAQCRIQVADPLSEGPADLLPVILCADLTHMGARIEAGFTGIETYASRLACQLVVRVQGKGEQQGFIGVGAGETAAESVCRGLQKCLDYELREQDVSEREILGFVELESIEDSRCHYYYQVLAIMTKQKPSIAAGRYIAGFPVIYVGTGSGWTASAGINETFALRNALKAAVMQAQNIGNDSMAVSGVFARSISAPGPSSKKLAIPDCESPDYDELLQSAINVLKEKQRPFFLYELHIEPFSKEGLIKVTGVSLGEEGSK